MPRPDPDRHAELFAAHRRELVGAAYRVLGRLQAAEDAVQETWLRWSRVDLARVEHPRAYLLQATTRQALNALRHEQRLREQYVGPWLPEPVDDLDRLGVRDRAALLDAETRARGADRPVEASDPALAAELADSVSFAMLVVLESLSPAERAAFILREVFGLDYEEVAAALDRSPAATRQLVSRANAHVRERAPRHPVDAATHREVTERFLAAADGGSLDDLVALLAPDVVLITDGGGLRRAALRPIVGVEKVLRFFAGILARPDTAIEPRLGELNGQPALIGLGPDGVDLTATLVLDGGLVTSILLVRNPEKLANVKI